MKKPSEFRILHQDESLIVVDKPAGLAVLPGRGRIHSLVAMLQADSRLGGKKPLIIHRIDADTSGVVLLALTPAAQKNLAEQFRKRTVTKEYWALVRGTPLHESGSVDMPVGPDPHDPKRMTIRGSDAKLARTKWVVESRFAGITLLKVFPVTGRRHQIRVHLKAMGYPLAVDPLYGGTELKLSEFKRRFKLGKFQEERPLISRLTLHAKRITIAHPETGAETTFEADLPKDFRATLSALDKWAHRGSEP